MTISRQSGNGEVKDPDIINNTAAPANEVRGGNDSIYRTASEAGIVVMIKSGSGPDESTFVKIYQRPRSRMYITVTKPTTCFGATSVDGVQSTDVR